MVLGPTEILILIIVVLILLFGATKIPELARSLGRAKGEFDRGKIDSERELRRERRIPRAPRPPGPSPEPGHDHDDEDGDEEEEEEEDDKIEDRRPPAPEMRKRRRGQ